MGFILVVAGVVGIASAALQAADALGYLELRSYPFLKTQSRALKWAYAGYMALMGIVGIVLGVAVRW